MKRVVPLFALALCAHFLGGCYFVALPVLIAGKAAETGELEAIDTGYDQAFIEGRYVHQPEGDDNHGGAFGVGFWSLAERDPVGFFYGAQLDLGDHQLADFFFDASVDAGVAVVDDRFVIGLTSYLGYGGIPQNALSVGGKLHIGLGELGGWAVWTQAWLGYRLAHEVDPIEREPFDNCGVSLRGGVWVAQVGLGIEQIDGVRFFTIALGLGGAGSAHAAQ